MRAPPPPSPAHWLNGLAASLRAEFGEGKPIEGVAGGALWLSLRVGNRFLWLMCPNELRAAWLTASPAPREWLSILERHTDSPFARELRGQHLVDARALQDGSGLLDGLRLELLGGGALAMRFFPRPGALWIEAPGGEITAQQGRMDGPLLVESDAGFDSFDLDTHALASEAALRGYLDTKLHRWLESNVRRTQQQRTRRLMAQEADLARATAQLDLRGKADLLAAHLHELRAGQNVVVLDDFEGRSRSIELDPKLTPAANLDSLYRRAAKAERTVATLKARLRDLRAELAEGNDPLQRLEAAATLEDRIELARQLGVPLAPPSRPAIRGGPRRATRLPYRSYRLRSGEELRVGRSAKDNDELLRHHSAGKDLWLHAQGVEGSHVIVRQSDAAATPAGIEAAARVAAEFSKARNSKLVPVIVTERRYVRKPRKAPPGTVVAERARTLFVEPGLPDGCERIRPEESD
jgi:hypothetical protein